jgi:hypothetical protein
MSARSVIEFSNLPNSASGLIDAAKIRIPFADIDTKKQRVHFFSPEKDYCRVSREMRGGFFLVDTRSKRMILPRIKPLPGSDNLCDEVKPQRTERGLPQRGKTLHDFETSPKYFFHKGVCH